MRSGFRVSVRADQASKSPEGLWEHYPRISLASGTEQTLGLRDSSRFRRKVRQKTRVGVAIDVFEYLAFSR